MPLAVHTIFPTGSKNTPAMPNPGQAIPACAVSNSLAPAQPAPANNTQGLFAPPSVQQAYPAGPSHVMGAAAPAPHPALVNQMSVPTNRSQMLTELELLVRMRSDGFLDDVEFAAAKRKLLNLM